MKKFFKSRWFVALLGGILFIGTLVGLTLKSRDLMLQMALTESGALEQAEEKQAKAEAEAPPKKGDIRDSADTPESEEQENNEPQQKITIKRHFEILDRITAAGELEMTDPSLGELVQLLHARNKYQNQREAELEELNSQYLIHFQRLVSWLQICAEITLVILMFWALIGIYGF